METTKNTELFRDLYKIDCKKYTKTLKSGGRALTYLSWSWAWKIFKEHCPDANYSVREWNEIPYLADDNLGYMVETSVTTNGETLTMRLPVMNSSNKAMKSAPYTYDTYKTQGLVVEQATMFDINTATMRCLVKNLAMFGLGLYIYEGEDLPNPTNHEETAKDIAEREKKELEEQVRKDIEEAKAKIPMKTAKQIAEIKEMVDECSTDKSLVELFNLQNVNAKDEKVKLLFKNRKNEIKLNETK